MPKLDLKFLNTYLVYNTVKHVVKTMVNLITSTLMFSDSQDTADYADMKVWGKIELPEDEYPVFTFYNAPLFERSPRPAVLLECEDTSLHSWTKYLVKNKKLRKTVQV